MKHQRRLYLTDQDARAIEQVLAIRTAQLTRAHVMIACLSAALTVLVVILSVVMS